MIRKNDSFNVKIVGMSFEGLGIAKIPSENERDFVIFVHNAVPGDEIVVRVVKVEKKYAYGIIETLLQPSEKRVCPSCTTFEKCGGCVMLNMNYEAELAAKKEFVVSAMRRYGVGIPVNDVVPSPETEHYRNKVILPLSPNGKFGFYARASHRNIENNDCLLQDRAFAPLIAAAEKFIAENNIVPYDEQTGKGLFRQLYLRSARATGEICVCAVLNGKKLPKEADFAEKMTQNGATCVYLNENTTRGNTLLGSDFRRIGGKERITDVLCGQKFEISPRAFYQINRSQTENLYRYAINLAQITPESTVLDLFCGIGTITLTAANAGAKKVIGVEIVEEAIGDAKRNAAINHIRNAEFFAADAAKTLEIIKKTGAKPDIITVDPPRKGLSDDARAAVVALTPERIVYISCNPETLARDIAAFAAAGYAPDSSAQLFDMFPRTQHIECAVSFTAIKQ